MMENRDLDARRRAIDDLTYHQARVLLLVSAVAASPGHQQKLDGLTKLAKLDFLVRYPALTPVVLDVLPDDHVKLHLTPKEVSAPTEVEDPMIRYKYGPWDDRYYPVVGALVSRGLLKYVKGRRGSVALTPTPEGKKFAEEFVAQEPTWRCIADRCEAVADASAGLTGSALKKRIYERLPELMNRPHREVIT